MAFIKTDNLKGDIFGGITAGIVALPLALAFFSTWRDDVISMLVIFIGGCINYLICLVFFKKKES